MIEGINLITSSSTIPDLPVNIISTHEAEEPEKKGKKRVVKETFSQWLKRET